MSTVFRLGLIVLSSLCLIPYSYAKQPTDEQLSEFFRLKGTDKAYESVVSSISIPLSAIMDSGSVKVKDKDKAGRVSKRVKNTFTWKTLKPKVYKFYKSNYSYEEIAAYIELLKRPEYRVMMMKEDALRPSYDKVLQTSTFQNFMQILLQIQIEDKLK